MIVAEVAETLGISKSHACKIVHRLNQELKDKGFITIAGGGTLSACFRHRGARRHDRL